MSNISNARRPVIFVGGANPICGEAIRLFANATDVSIVLADANEDALRRVVAKLDGRDVAIRKVNIFNPDELRNTISDAALVVHGAQPYYKTSGPVIAACIDVKVPYLDFSDDVTSTLESLNLHDRAAKEGVPCFINCGSAPGMTNLLAVEIAQEFDTVESIDVYWMVSEEGGELGREVLEHLMDITGGPCLTWADGKAAVHENWVETSYAPVIEGSNDLFYESVHPESVTLPRRFPNVNRIRTSGALYPRPFNGLARGLGAAVSSGGLSMDDAIFFLAGLQSKSSGNWSDMLTLITAQLRGGDITLNQLSELASLGISAMKPWNYALWGIVDQVRKGGCTIAEVLGFFIDNIRGKPAPRRGGMLVRGVGTRNGHPAVVTRRTPTVHKDSFLKGSMATSIGACCAAFTLLALDLGEQRRPGFYCPEDWAKPEAFFKALEKLGCPRDQIIESI